MRTSLSTALRGLSGRVVLAAVVALATLLSLGLVARAELSTDTTTAEPAPSSSGAAGTRGGGDDNVAVATNQRDGSSVYATRLKVVLTGQDTVDSGNAAVAAASCSDCTTVAIAIEGVVVWGEPETVVPVNLALALNTECDNCQTLAAAYQYVTAEDSRVRITGEGRRTIAALRQQLNTLRTSGLGILEVAAEVDRIAGEFYTVLRDEVVPIGRPQGDFPAPGATPTPFPEDASAAQASPGTTATETAGSASPQETAQPSESAPAPQPTESTSTATPTSTP